MSPGLLTAPPPCSLSTVTLFSTSQGKRDLPRDPRLLIYIQPWFLAFPTQGPREAGMCLSRSRGASPYPSRGLTPIIPLATPCISVPFFPCFVLHRSKLLGRVEESCCQSLSGPPVPSRVLAPRTLLDLSSGPLCGFFPWPHLPWHSSPASFLSSSWTCCRGEYTPLPTAPLCRHLLWWPLQLLSHGVPSQWTTATDGASLGTTFLLGS